MLILGFDGLSPRVLKQLPLTRSAIERAGLKHLDVTEPFNGMWERGWLKIYTGMAPENIGAYYNMVIQGGYRKASPLLPEWKNHEDCIWNLAARNHKTFGGYGLPGTFPPPRLKKGFFVSGAGAGAAPSVKVIREACSTDQVYETVKAINPTWEPRAEVFGKKTIHEYLNICYEYVFDSIAAFNKLSDKHPADVRFFASRWPDCVLGPIYSKFNDCNTGSDSSVREDLNKHFSQIDNLLSNLILSSKDNKIFMCSDHGMVPKIGDFSLRATMRKLGYTISSAKKIKKYGLLREVKRRLYHPLKPLLSYIGYKGSSMKISYSLSDLWIAVRYIPGFFINDERFGGKRYTASERRQLINNFIEQFEKNKTKIGINLVLSANRHSTSGKLVSPDILVDWPEGFFLSDNDLEVLTTSDLSSVNEKTKVESISDISGGVKSMDPLVCIPNDIILNKKNNDLNDFHKIIAGQI